MDGRRDDQPDLITDRLLIPLAIVLSVTMSSHGQSAAVQDTDGWRDLSPHAVQFVTVDRGVRLEVLDWGGRGRPLILLTGTRLTAHVYDEFAPGLRACCHVYAITRRGFGGSSRPITGYDDQRLADDVLEVMNQLKLVKPVLIGHSLAGGELTTLGSQHPDRLAGLVFVEALDDPRDGLGSNPEWVRLLQRLPAGFLESEGQASAVPPDYSSFPAYRAWQTQHRRYALPESELRQLFVANPDGTMGPYKGSTSEVDKAIGSGQKRRDYSRIRLPVLAIRGLVPQPLDDRLRASGFQLKSTQERADLEAFDRVTAAHLNGWVANLLRGVPNARVVDLPQAGHYVFLTREADVLREVQAFIDRLR